MYVSLDFRLDHDPDRRITVKMDRAETVRLRALLDSYLVNWPEAAPQQDATGGVQ